ncbi:coiled-coil domain-containing protein 9 [Cygnus atratus]|uniref:coiled-coil domain-containing protein 9 n=1 Tax=Cygnus atratus TaxID=8868 RepID=UPI0021B73BA1|nr:coiled-coil domain-containing protein 9 [Cygnus atratus]
MAAALDLRSKEEKDAELDKRIEALRKKNEALIRRYQEIEEDRRRAEQEGVAVTAPRHRRPPEPERRQGHKEGGLGPPPAPRERGARGRRSGGRGGALGGPGGDAGPDRKSQEWEERRRQNIERMNEEMEKIAEYERNQRDGLRDRNPVRSFLDDPRRRGPAQDERHGGSRRHGRNWGGADFEGVRAGLEQRGRRRAAPTMTGRERAEYARWKQEREEIDRQRLARHRQPTGQWRREWDADKTDGMFNDAPDADMHDDRWEEEKEPAAQPGGADGKGAQELEAAPSGTPLQPPPSPEEDEDEWEDVSEEDDEEDEDEEDEEDEEDDEGSTPPSPETALQDPEGPPPGTVEITDFQRVRFRKRSPPPAAS